MQITICAIRDKKKQVTKPTKPVTTLSVEAMLIKSKQ
jgi:hypothetical protein